MRMNYELSVYARVKIFLKQASTSMANTKDETRIDPFGNTWEPQNLRITRTVNVER
jgi:hypothetical protein